MNNLHLFNNKSKKNNSKGFYIALGVCLIAIGVAAWTTYDSVVNYASPDTASSSSDAQKTNQTLSGVTVKEPSSQSSSQLFPSSSEPASQPESSKPVVSSRKPTSSKPAAKPANASVTSFHYPVGSAIAQQYSGENPVYNKTMKDWRAHTGIDITAKEGDAVKAAAGGTVKDVIADDTLGNVVVIMHGDIEAYYCGLGQTSVKKGQTVKQGQEIGTLGVVPSESQDGPHLHFAMKQNGKYIDPASVLKK